MSNTLKQLRLSGLLQTLDVRLQEAVANRFNPAIHRKDIYDLATGNFIRQTGTPDY